MGLLGGQRHAMETCEASEESVMFPSSYFVSFENDCVEDQVGKFHTA